MHFVNAGNQDFVETFPRCQRRCGTREGPMETNDLKSMPLEELWKSVRR
jgi:hypothetical protein